MRVYKQPGSRFWYFEFEHNGVPVRRSSKLLNKKDAKKAGDAFYEKLIKGEIGLDDPEAKTIGQLLDYLQADYQTRGIWKRPTQSMFKYVRQDFGSTLAHEVNVAYFQDKVKKLREQDYEGNTIHNRLLIVAQAYLYASEYGLWKGTVPRMKSRRYPSGIIPRLKNDDNIREGFFQREDIDRLMNFLPTPAMRDFCLLSYLIGWRKGAISGLEWRDVRDGRLYLRGVLSKNKKPYYVPIIEELVALIERRRAARVAKLPDGTEIISSYVFHEDGQPIVDFTYFWRKACVLAGYGKFVCNSCGIECPGRTRAVCPKCKGYLTYTPAGDGKPNLFHDFRRSADRNLIEGDGDRKKAMLITGHKTESTFERYHIVRDDDLQKTLRKSFQYSEAQRGETMPITSHCPEIYKEKKA